MCGIAGLLNPNDPETAAQTVARLIEPLRHRGPDGIRVAQARGWAAAHARLSIIDLEGGWQPISAAGSTVIGNGEIYNYIELAQEFGLEGQLATASDFEPLLHIYGRIGEAVFDRLRGMYAFCLIGHDGRSWLVRDAFGIKPLSVRKLDGELAFASEPRALLQDGPVQPRLDAIADVLALNYVTPASGTTGWNGIETLAPGEIRQVDDGALSSPRMRPAAPVVAGRHFDSDLQAVEALDRILEDSVRVHQRSDVPYGLFLSGGIDSATIAVLMSRLNPTPVKAWTCGFAGTDGADERSGAETLARSLNLDWRSVTFDEQDFWNLAPQAAAALDQPCADYAILPTLKLAQSARQDVRVVLSGEGGDELFGGYGRYRRALRPRWLGGRPAQPQITARFLKDGRQAALARWQQSAAAASAGASALDAAQRADIATWLPNDLLLKLDRCLMAHGLEGRTPFLDPVVADFALSLPQRLRVRGRYGKWILRKWLETRAPAANPWARKQGFTVPVARWIAPRRADLARGLAKSPLLAQVCDMEAVAACLADEAQSSSWWPLMFVALWDLIHVGKSDPAEALGMLLGGTA